MSWKFSVPETDAAPAGTATHSAAAVAAAVAAAKENLRFIASPPNLRTDRGMTAPRTVPSFPRLLPPPGPAATCVIPVCARWHRQGTGKPDSLTAESPGFKSSCGGSAEFAQGRTLPPACRARRSYPGKVSSHAPNQARVIPLRPVTAAVAPVPARSPDRSRAQAPPRPAPAAAPAPWTRPAPSPSVREPLWRHIVGDVLRRERLAQERTLKDVAETARISMPYLSEIERGRKEPSSEVLAAAARALGLSLTDLLGLAQGELARLARPRPAKAPAPVTPRHDFGSGPAGPAGHDHDAVPPADAAPGETVLPVETVPPAEALARAETVLPAETVPPAEALGTRCTGQVTSQLRMSLAA